MTAFAIRGAMLAMQGKLGIFVVIEKDGFPITFGVTGLALLAETAFMRIILTMTTDTGLGCFLVVGIFVAVLTFHVFVLA